MLKNGLVKFTLITNMGAFAFSLGMVNPTIKLSSQQSNQVNEAVDDQIQLAKKRRRKGKSKSRKKIISSEKTFKARKGRSTKIDFDEVDISGQRKDPMGSLVGSARNQKELNLIQIRREWHKEMIQSASSLD